MVVQGPRWRRVIRPSVGGLQPGVRQDTSSKTLSCGLRLNFVPQYKMEVLEQPNTHNLYITNKWKVSSDSCKKGEYRRANEGHRGAWQVRVPSIFLVVMQLIYSLACQDL